MKEKLGLVLLVEDEENMHDTLRLNLELEGYGVTSAYDGRKALELIGGEYFDLIILDVMIPEIDGLTVAETVRINGIETPILILSAKGTGDDRVAGLRKGADDYLSKPFNLEELLLRVHKLIDKNNRITDKGETLNTYSFGGNTIYFNAQEAVNFNGEKVELSKKEVMLLKLLIENKSAVVPREKILQMVWGYTVYPNTRTIDNFILNFRKHFELNPKMPKHFHSIRSVGYKFSD